MSISFNKLICHLTVLVINLKVHSIIYVNKIDFKDDIFYVR